MYIYCLNCNTTHETQELKMINYTPATWYEPEEYDLITSCCESHEFEDAKRCDLCGNLTGVSLLKNNLCKLCLKETALESFNMLANRGSNEI